MAWLTTPMLMTAVNETDRIAVRHAQRVLRLAETGELDGETRAAVRGFQGLFGLRSTGYLDEPTMEKLEQVRSIYS